MNKYNNKRTFRDMQDCLDSDDELPTTYTEKTELPAYLDDDRFDDIGDLIEFPWLNTLPIRNPQTQDQGNCNVASIATVPDVHKEEKTLKTEIGPFPKKMPNMAETIVNLEVIFKNVEDITDPSSMDKVLMVLEETRMADDNYMELLVEKVGTETITWSQPWYQKSTCLTRKPKIPANETDTYESGSFTHDEYKRVEKNWNKFVRKFELPNTPVCLARWRNTNKARNSMKSVEEFVRCFVTAYLAKEANSVGNSAEVSQHSTEVLHGLSHNYNIVVESKVSKVLAINVDASSPEP
ncbi:hypothetical protein MSG28_011175 [Choristoneura fumiferana]|uniref:Uncharacterized protein n=1 Tax=Choristoneura fumiferana TaxID=7141 RepID=A0ACC0KRA7_CHOFU|nr:hypothetical protein MSG28_011175 [Choristoneura fumiferana]